MALSPKQDSQLACELLNHCGRIQRETSYNPKELRRILASEGAQRTLAQISSHETTGLARLYELGRPDLAIERYVLDSQWVTVLEPTIVTQCRVNLGLVR